MMMNKNQQRQVWQRVYPPKSPARPIPKEMLRQSQQRLQQNLRFYETQTTHPVYGPAFQHLIRQTEEHIQMLQQIQTG